MLDPFVSVLINCLGAQDVKVSTGPCWSICSFTRAALGILTHTYLRNVYFSVHFIENN